MLTSDNKNLWISESWRTDHNLPKHNSDKSTSFGFTVSSNAETFVGGSAESTSSTFSLKRWFLSIFKKFKYTPKPKLNPSEFFNEIFTSISTDLFSPEIYKSRTNGYLKSIESAKRAGQVALRESLESKIEIVKLESLLFGAESIKTIPFSMIVDFYKMSEKGLSLDYIKNFNRLIPSKVIDRKVDLDKLRVFDNYVVLHYDPEQKSYKETQEEKKHREDPILFGIINGVEKLYYVADWKDEFCDLTMDDFIEEFGEDAINKNNITVNV